MLDFVIYLKAKDYDFEKLALESPMKRKPERLKIILP